MNVGFRAREMQYILGNARASAAFVKRAVREQFLELANDSAGVTPQIIAFEGVDGKNGSESFERFLGELGVSGEPTPAVDCAADHGALLCYTSGTTSTPKPVLHSHNSEIYGVKGYISSWRIERGDRGLVTLPLAWIYGLSSASLSVLTAGGTVVLMTHFNPERALEAIEGMRASIFFGSMSMYVKMVDVLRHRDFDLSSLRLCVNGAEPCPESSVQAFENRTGLKLIGSYGLSESRPLLVQDPLDRAAPAGTCGRLLPGAAIRLLDSSGAEVGVGEVGEAFIRCPGNLTSYFREPLMTGERVDSEGWLRSGDLLKRDAAGYYFVVGRVSDMIIRSGVNIAPAEIEGALVEPANVAQAAVLGAPDPVSGQSVIAFVVPVSGATVTEEQLKEHLGARIASFKLPQKIVVRDALPTNVSGKLDRGALKTLAEMMMWA